MNNTEYPELRRHQLEAVEALKEVDRIFKKNNIDYYLLAGSVLGAVRHKGFIPWDDDIDVGILWKDKDKAIEALKEIPEPYEWVHRSIDRSFPRMYGKVLKERRGLVDVFVLVKTSDNALKRRIQWVGRKILFKLYKSKISYINPNELRNINERVKLRMAQVVSKFFSMDAIEKAVERNEARYENQSVEYYINLYSPYSMNKELIRADWLSPKGSVFFEGSEYPTVNDPNSYLTHLYGNYMVLPDENERVATHEELF